METNPTLFKLLKITNVRNEVNYFPLNRTNKQFHETYNRSLSNEKREKYKVEEVELTTEQAAELGVAEAHSILYPPTRKGQPNAANTNIMEMLIAQNAKLMEMLEAKNETTKPKK
jgi:hypothetical protein